MSYFRGPLYIDEASLLRLEVFVELHTLCQFEMDSKPCLPMVLSGQTHLIDNLRYPGPLPLASRKVEILIRFNTVCRVKWRQALLGSNLSRG